MRRSASKPVAGAPSFVAPCLAQLARTPPTGPQWVHEIKYDGYRVQAHIRPGEVRLLTRNGLDWTAKLGRVADELQSLDVEGAVIDGEAIVQDSKGIPDFGALQRELKRGASARIVLMAFDLLHLDGRDMRPRSLAERKDTLARILGIRSPSSLLQLSAHITGDGAAILESACRLGLEGIVSKRLDLPYRSGRRGDWIKVKCTLADPFVVIGYVDSKAASQAIGSLVVAYHHDGKLTYAGRVGTGFSSGDARAIWQRMQPLRSDVTPTTGTLTRQQLDGVTWVRPELVAQVEYRAWSTDRILRHASFKALLDEKRPEQVELPRSLQC